MTITTDAAKMGGEVVTSTTTTCPSWCTEHISEDVGGGLVSHDHEIYRQDDVIVWIAQPVDEPEEAPFVGLDASGTTLTPDRARQAAAALLEAAELLEVEIASADILRELGSNPTVPQLAMFAERLGVSVTAALTAWERATLEGSEHRA